MVKTENCHVDIILGRSDFTKHHFHFSCFHFVAYFAEFSSLTENSAPLVMVQWVSTQKNDPKDIVAK